MEPRNKPELEARLQLTINELELINTLRRKNSRRWDVLLSRAQTLSWVLRQREAIEQTPSITDFRELKRSGATIDEIRTALQGVLPL